LYWITYFIVDHPLNFRLVFKLVDPIENRYRDVEARAQAAKDLLQCIVDYQTAAQSLPAGEREEVCLIWRDMINI